MGKPSHVVPSQNSSRLLRLRPLKPPSKSAAASTPIPTPSTSSSASRNLQTCTSCGFSTRHRVLFDRHAKRCQNGLSPPQVVARNYKCKKCTFTTTKSKMFLYHLRDDHSEGINIFPCDLCEYASRYKCKVLRHRKFVHRAAKPIEPEELCEDQEIKMETEHQDVVDLVNDGEEEQGIDGIHEMEQGDLSDVEIIDNTEGASGSLDGEDSQGIQSSIPSIQSPIKSTDNAFDYIRRLSDSPQSHQPAYQCALCTYSNVQKWKVANHVRSFHMKKKVFKCSFCPFVTSRKIEFCIHKTQHSDKKVWACQECEYKSISRTNFDRHLASHEADLPVKCAFCSYSSTGEAVVQRHITECHPQEIMPHQGTSSLSAAINNNNNNIEPVLKQERPAQTMTLPVQKHGSGDIVCSVCGLHVKNESKLRIHMVSHSTESIHCCPLCTLKYKRSSDLNRHMKRKHGARLRDFFFMGQQEQPLNLTTAKTEGEEYEGEMDQPESGENPGILGGEEAPLDLSLPKEVAQMPENLKCTHCSYLAKWPSDLRRHLLVHSVEKRYKCPCCHRKYKYQFDLNMHLRRMHRVPAGRTKVTSVSNGPPVVNIANLESSSVTLASNVSEEETLAPEANNNNPQVPPLKVRRYRLTRQQISPQGKYKCDYCPYLGKYQSEVDRHMRLHTGDKPYSCLFCTYRSHWRGDMKRHLKKHHSKEEGVDDDNIGAIMERTYQPDLPAEPEADAQLSEDQSQAEGYEGSTDDPMEIQEENGENNSARATPVRDGGSEQDGMEFIMLTPSSTASSTASKAGDKRSNMCPYCPFTCEAPSKLKCHMEIHENLKRFKCAHCGKRSNWTWDVRKHIKKEHPGQELSVVVMEEEEARESLPEYLHTHYKVTPKKELPDKNELPTQVPLNRITDQLPPVDMLGVLAPLQMGNLSDSSYQDEEEMSDNSHSLPFTYTQPQVKHSGIATKRCRPFKCSKCGRRSNWKWDMNKHIRNVHPQAKLIILSPDEARATMPKGGFKNANIGKKENYVAPPVIKPEPTPTPSPSPSKTKHNHQFDSNRTKKFKCSACPYRSDYRSDIGRHLKRLHKPGSATILMLTDEEARATLQQYKDRWVRGKFVFSPAKEKMYEEYDKQKLKKCLTEYFGDGSTMDFAPSDGASYAGSDNNWGDSGSEGPPVNPEREEEAAATSASTSDRGRKWKCPKCSYSSPNKKVVVRHMRQHPKAKVFQCRLCGEASDYRNSMYRHVRNRHNSTDYSSVVHESIAYVTTIVKAESEVNVDNDAPVTYRCRLCGHTSCWKSGIVRHIAESHSKDKDSGDNVEVLQVRQIIPALPQQITADGLICETVSAVVDVKQLKCDTCPYQTNKAPLLRIHQTYHRPQPGNKFKCRYCPYYVSAVRLLHQHTRLHTHSQPIETSSTGLKLITRPVEDEMEEGMDLSTSLSSSNSAQSSPGRRYYCDQCPAVSRNKNDFLYHKQFHRPKPSSPFKCRLCNYWVSQRRLLRQHERVHLTEYIEHYHNNNNNCPKPEVLKTYADRGASVPQMVLASPAKSEASDYGDAVDLANIKQQIIASKITSTPISPEKFKENGQGNREPFTSDGYMVNTSGQLLKSGSVRKLHQCRFCPYTNIRATVLRMHENMHGPKPGKDLLKCQYCDYHVGNKGLLSHHMKVHSSTYRPGTEEINDTDNKKEDGEEKTEEGPKAATSSAAASSAPKGEVLDLSCMPPNSEYYVKYNAAVKEHVLERASFKKWCCEKCPYATMKRAQFERHVSLHGSRQKYICEFCDYSVPAYHLLLQHKKLHLSPNPNLLTTQSLTNLQRLPTIPADVAAAANFPSNTSDPASTQGTQDSTVLFENSSEFSEPKKVYRCDRCPYQNIRRDHLLSHLKFHMVQSDLKCPYCDYSVSKQHLLVQHIKVHFSGPGSETFTGPGGVLNLSYSKSSVQENGGGSVKAEEKQPEYIDITELGHSTLLETEAAAAAAAGKSTVSKTESETKMEVDSAEEGGEEERGQGSEKVEDKGGLCEYCERVFDTTDELKQHENQHLIGNKQ